MTGSSRSSPTPPSTHSCSRSSRWCWWWTGPGSEESLGPFPAGETSQVYAYGIVNLVIYAAGLELVYLGHRVGSRRRADTGVHLDPAVTH